MDKETATAAVQVSRQILADVVRPKRRSILEHQANVSLSIREFANMAQQLEILTAMLAGECSA
jgi:hypothetical protein